MARTRHIWAFAVAALLPLGACSPDDGDADELPESRVPEYEVTIPEIDVDVNMDSATIPVPDVDVDVDGDADVDER
jgi:hypothetical protein